MESIANKYISPLLKGALCLSLIVLIHHLPLMAQESNGGSTKLIIIKERVDADGNKTVERIEKEGAEAEAFDMENFSNNDPQIQWKRFDFGEGDEIPFQSFDFGGQMPDFNSFFEELFDSRSGGGMQGFDGFDSFGFDGFADRPRLGVQIQGLESQEGVLVTTLQPGSPAAEVGIKEGDVILAVDGEEITDPNQLANLVREHELGDKIAVDVLREERHLSFEVQLGERKSKPMPSRKI